MGFQRRNEGAKSQMVKTHCMVVSQQFVEKVNRLVADKTLVVRVDKAVPRFLLEAAQNVVVLCIELNLVAIQVIKEVICAEHFGNLDKLVRVGVAVEEGLLAKDHGSEHGAQTPHVQAVVVLLKVHQQLRAFEVARSHTHVVLGAGVVKFGQAPVDQAQLFNEQKCLLQYASR